MAADIFTIEFSQFRDEHQRPELAPVADSEPCRALSIADHRNCDERADIVQAGFRKSAQRIGVITLPLSQNGGLHELKRMEILETSVLDVITRIVGAIGAIAHAVHVDHRIGV